MHVYLVTERNPKEQTNEFYSKTSEMSFEIENSIFKGKHSPLVSKLEFWDIRLYEQCVPRFLSRLQAIDPLNLKSENHKFHLPSFFIFVLKIVRKVFGYSVPKFKPGAKRHPFHGFCYVIVLGCKKDPKEKHTGKELL